MERVLNFIKQQIFIIILINCCFKVLSTAQIAVWGKSNLRIWTDAYKYMSSSHLIG